MLGIYNNIVLFLFDILVKKSVSFTDLISQQGQLQRKNHALKMQVHRLKKRILRKYGNVSVRRTIERETKASQQRKIEHLQKLLSEFLSGQKLDFVMSQVRCALKKAKGRRWTYKDKALALSLLHSSPKTYRLLRRIFDLPSVATLKLAMKNIDVRPGFNDVILQALGKKLANRPTSAKIVTLVIDEMAIKEGLSYDSGKDVIEGFSDGVTKTNELANHAIVFMVKAIVEKWKQAIGFFLCSGPMSGSDMKTLLMECISKLKNIGLKVLVMIGDQGSNNRNLFETQLAITKDQPFFMHDTDKIFVMYDPPHLVKNVRNNLKKHGLTVSGKDIMWQHIKDFFDKDSSKAIRMAPKLTPLHFSLKMFAALSVKKATQVLSHSVAAGMAVMAQWEIIPKEAAQTAEFVESMDQVFNAFNSRIYSSSAVMRHAMSETSGHKEFLSEKLKWFKNIKSKGKRQPDCLRGWQISIQALLMIWDVLHTEYHVKYLLTSRLNQDCLENLFSVIRHKGAQRDNPDVSQFRAAFRQCMVDSVMMPGKNANCVEDVDKFLLTLKNVNNPAPNPTPILRPSPLDGIPENVRSIMTMCTLPLDDGLSNQETNILAYIGGYIVKKLQKKNHICHECDEKIAADVEEGDSRYQFLKEKNIKEAKYGLCAPSNELLGAIQLLELEYRKLVDQCMIIKESVKATLVASLLQNVKLYTLKCNTCHVEQLVVHLMVNIRLHHTIKETNRSLRENKDRKNRKVLKFSHR